MFVKVRIRGNGFSGEGQMFVKLVKVKLVKEERGASAVEYAMLVGLISLFSFAAYRALGRLTYAVIENMWKELTGAGS